MLLDTIDSTNPVTKIDKVLPIPEYAAKSAAHQPFLPADRKIVPDSRFFNTRFDTDTSIFWLNMSQDCPAKFTPELVQAFRDFQLAFRHRYRPRIQPDDAEKRPEYLVLGSEISETFNLGGDLPYFYSLIKSGDRQALLAYAQASVELVYQNHVSLELPMTTIALVRGNAMGGGMEAAISANVLIAERQVQMGLPEVLFNMFPGMGAYQFLSRRISPVAAEKMIMSGKTYSAEELYDMGIIDVLAEEGKGEQAVREYVIRNRRNRHAACGLRRAIRAADPVTREALMSVVDIWVETAMGLSDMDLSRMNYLIRAQKNRGF